jgi:hypothetical protein
MGIERIVKSSLLLRCRHRLHILINYYDACAFAFKLMIFTLYITVNTSSCNEN